MRLAPPSRSASAVVERRVPVLLPAHRCLKERTHAVSVYLAFEQLRVMAFEERTNAGMPGRREDAEALR
jgi:hypothetical protein